MFLFEIRFNSIKMSSKSYKIKNLILQIVSNFELICVRLVDCFGLFELGRLDRSSQLA
jgi:hypothetical protein